MILLIEKDTENVEALKKAVGRPTQHRSTITGSADLLRRKPEVDVVVLGPSVASQPAYDLAAELRVIRPDLGVVVVRYTVEGRALAEAMRSGVRDVLAMTDLDLLQDSVDRLQDFAATFRSSTEAEESSAGRVVTVFSAKGGCGKTTVATGLATLAATKGVGRVALVDLDLMFGDVAISVQLFPTHTIGDAVVMSESLDSEGLAKLMTRHPSGFDVLAAPTSPETKDSISHRLVAEVLTVLRSSYDLVVVDTSPSFEDHTLAALDHTDVLMLLVTPDIPALKNLKVALETLKLLRFPSERIRVVVNRSDADVGLTLQDIARTADVTIAGRIPSSRDVPASTNRGEVLPTSQPDHPVSRALADLLQVAEVGDDREVAPTQTSPRTSPWWRRQRKVKA
jgi:pilus assembly protein CpaE